MVRYENRRPNAYAIITGMKRLAVLLLSAVIPFTLLGYSTALAASPNISRSYLAYGSVSNGSLVSLLPGKSDNVEEANTANGSRLIGVVVQSNESLLAVNPSNTSVQVATDGVANVLVSNVNGNINVGQQVSVSPFNGVGSLHRDRILCYAIPVTGLSVQLLLALTVTLPELRLKRSLTLAAICIPFQSAIFVWL